MPSISYVVARSEPGHIIGCENRLPWRLRTDLRHFKSITTGHVVIMGRKTLDSIGHPLPNRINIVVSSSKKEDLPNLFFAESRESALLIADYFSLLRGLQNIFVVGGGSIYDVFRDLFNKIYLTEVFAEDIRGDAFFDYKFDRRKWHLIEEHVYPRSAFDEYPFCIKILEKKNKTKRYRYLSKFLKTDELLEHWEKTQAERARRVAV